MSFPQTRLTLIQRLASGGSEEDWQSFLKDYWGPICRFSLRFGARNLDDAEDVASQTFEVLWEKRLLVRWVANRAARLRTLLCSVVRNILSHRYRVRTSRDRLWQDFAEHLDELEGAKDEPVEAFYAAWAEDVVSQAVESLAAEYHAKRKGNYIRVLYGRLCRQLTIAQVAEALEITPANVDHYFRHAKARLAEKLEGLLRQQVQRYCPSEEAEQEFGVEWQRLGEYLEQHGGLEEAVGRAYELLDPAAARRQREVALTSALTRITSAHRISSDASPSEEKT